MQFLVNGPFEIPRKAANNHVDIAKKQRNVFWSGVNNERDGLSNGCGCYLFAISAGGGLTPWYVGKAEKQTFESEIFAVHKLNHYNDVLASTKSGRPVLFLMPKITPRGKLCKPTSGKSPSIVFLEAMLISMAIRRNDELKNKKDTALWKGLSVKGFYNSKGSGFPGNSAQQLKEALGV